MSSRAKATIVIVLTLVYVASPIDFCPDFLPGVGQLDDLVALFFGGKTAIGLLRTG